MLTKLAGMANCRSFHVAQGAIDQCQAIIEVLYKVSWT
jgi:hypothetical protein